MPLAVTTLAGLYSFWGQEQVRSWACSWLPADALAADKDVLAEAKLLETEGEALALLQQRYTLAQLTEAPVSPVLANLIYRLARRTLTSRFDMLSEAWVRDFTAADATLKAFARGIGDLGLAGAPAEDTSKLEVATTGAGRTDRLSLTTLEDW